MSTLPDIQRTQDLRDVFIDRVGVTGIKMPVRLLRMPGIMVGGVPVGAPTTVDTVGEFELSCSLSSSVKGTHMSRFTEVLQSHIDGGGIFSHESLQQVARDLAAKLESRYVKIRLVCDYFVLQLSPISFKSGVAPLRGVLEVELQNSGAVNKADYWQMYCSTGVEIQGKTCCPCSREISDFDHVTGMGKGAHAQRSHVAITVRHTPSTVIWFEELVEVCWKSFSSPVYPVLKRPDERAVTMTAYNNPKFVEDVIRDVVVNLRAVVNIEEIYSYKVRVQNAESIHYHDAFAEVEGIL